MKGSLATVVAILVLSLASWVGFYFLKAPLQPQETAVVVGICAVLVMIAKWLYGAITKKGSKSE